MCVYVVRWGRAGGECVIFYAYCTPGILFGNNSIHCWWLLICQSCYLVFCIHYHLFVLPAHEAGYLSPFTVEDPETEDLRHSVIFPKHYLGTGRPSVLTKVWLIPALILLIIGQVTKTLTHCIFRSSLSGLLTSSFRQHQESLAAERERRRQEREERLQRIEREERNKFK